MIQASIFPEVRSLSSQEPHLGTTCFLVICLRNIQGASRKRKAMCHPSLGIWARSLPESFRVVFQRNACLALLGFFMAQLAPSNCVISVGTARRNSVIVLTGFVSEPSIENVSVLACCGALVDAVGAFPTFHGVSLPGSRSEPRSE